jgi:hypothetical protein
LGHLVVGLLVALPVDYRLVCSLLDGGIGFFANSVRLGPETEAGADTRSSRFLEPKPKLKPKTKKTEISVWLVRISSARFSV